MSAIYNDGALLYGSLTMVISRAGVLIGTYVLENVTVSRPVQRIEQFNELGEPSRAAGVGKWINGSATAQIPISSTKFLQSGDTFTATFVTEIGAETFIIDSPDQPYGQNDYYKQTIKFFKRINAP